MTTISSGIARRVSYLRVWRSPGVLIMLAMFMGIFAGLWFGEQARVVAPLGDLFIRLLVAVAVPLVAVNMLAGLTSLDDLESMRRVGGRFCAFFVLTTSLAVCLGLAVTAVISPGTGVALPRTSSPTTAGQAPSLGDFLFNLFPGNVFAALAEGQAIQLLVFSLLLGIAAMLAPADIRLAFHRGASVLDIVLRELVALMMKFAPIGIGALAAGAAAQFGMEVFAPLSLFIVGIWIAQLIFAASILLLLALVLRQSPWPFLRATGLIYATAAATCSSMASLAVALRVAQERLKLPQSVYALTIPLGTQLSKEGTAIMLAAVLVFTAQAIGAQFTWSDYGRIVLVILLLAGASEGIPGGGLVKALILVEAFGLPLEIAAVAGGVYRVIDIGNTTVNMLGDMVGTQLVAALEVAENPDSSISEI